MNKNVKVKPFYQLTWYCDLYSLAHVRIKLPRMSRPSQRKSGLALDRKCKEVVRFAEERVEEKKNG